MENSTINLRDYVSVVAYLAFRSCQISKQCAQNPNLKKYEKSVNDPVTQADFKIQTLIIRTLNHFFPKLNIVGEETTQYEGQISLKFQEISLDNYPYGHLQQAVPYEQLCVWIDPIDNTKGFIKGKLQKVTTLIGLSRNNKAYLGIVATPYAIQNNQRVFKPRVNLGFVPSNQTFVTFEPHKWTRIFKPALHKPLKMLTSESNKCHIFHSIVKKHQAESSYMGGAGHKFNLIIFGEADVAIYIGFGNCRWDSCASEAIIKSMGGFFTDQNGKQIVYDPKNLVYGNLYGNICLFDQQLHRQIIADIALLKKNGKKE